MLVLNPTHRKHFYDNHCQIVRDSAEREELEKTRQAKKQELEKMIQRKRDEKQAKKEERDWIRQENGDRIRVRRRIIETTAPKKKIIPKNMDVIQYVFEGYRQGGPCDRGLSFVDNSMKYSAC